MHRILKVHPADNLIVALQDLSAGEAVQLEATTYTPVEDIPAKHKFTEAALQAGDPVYMYGVLVGKAKTTIPKGARVTVDNVSHEAESFEIGEANLDWVQPKIGRAHV